FFFQAEDGIRDFHVTGVQTCALPISMMRGRIGVESALGKGSRFWFDIPRAEVEAESSPRVTGRAGDRALVVDKSVAQREALAARSEERRVGKGGRSGGAATRLRKKVV